MFASLNMHYVLALVLFDTFLLSCFAHRTQMHPMLVSVYHPSVIHVCTSDYSCKVSRNCTGQVELWMPLAERDLSADLLPVILSSGGVNCSASSADSGTLQNLYVEFSVMQ